MKEIETVLMCFMVPILLALTYVAGRCDMLGLIIETAKEKSELEAKTNKDNKED
jgi:hypothetical protein